MLRDTGNAASSARYPLFDMIDGRPFEDARDLPSPLENRGGLSLLVDGNSYSNPASAWSRNMSASRT
jgi:hypothetical protein